jgi:hypothetical protein
MADQLQLAAERAELEAAMTCSCGALRAILECGLVCSEGCGRIIPFSALSVSRVDGAYDRAGAIESLLRREFPGQIVT